MQLSGEQFSERFGSETTQIPSFGNVHAGLVGTQTHTDQDLATGVRNLPLVHDEIRQLALRQFGQCNPVLYHRLLRHQNPPTA